MSRLSGFDIKLAVGGVNETVEVNGNSVQIDTTSTAVGDNLDQTFYQQVPVARNVGSLFYIAPGATNSGGTGTSNPSIGGATGLENQYIIDGVNLTDVGYGGLGVFSPTYGSLGAGINLSFVQEVQVKEGALEPKFGRANGGVALIVTKTGGTQYHGALSAYAAPDQFSAAQRYADDYGRINTHGRISSTPQFDTAVELGGPIIPKVNYRDKLFFFGSFNPSLNQYNYAPPAGSGLANMHNGGFTNSITTYSWAGKVTYKPNDRVTFEASAFGDPASSNRGFGKANQDTFPNYPNINLGNDTPFSRWDFGSRSEVVRMNAQLSDTWVLDIAATAKQSHFTESGFSQTYNILDDSLTVDNPATGLPFGPEFTAQGLGFYQNPDTHAYSFAINTEKIVKAFGTHSLSIGWEYDRGIYDLYKGYSGADYTFPTANDAGDASAVPAPLAGQQADAGFKLVVATQTNPDGSYVCKPPYCAMYTPTGQTAAVPVYLSQNRGIFSARQAYTGQSYHQIYGNDNWTINRFVTVNAGIRWDEEQLNGTIQQYVFNDNWSPRVGISVDPRGDGKSKVFFNYARYTQSLPNDAAVRELNQESDIYRANFAPQQNADGSAVLVGGTVVPVLDQQHLVSGDPAAGPQAGGSISYSGGAPELISAGTKLNLEEEFVGGIERQLPGGFVLSARYTDRRLLRILEDLGGLSPEGVNAGGNQDFLIGNPNSSSDYYINEQEIPYDPAGPAPAACSAPDAQDYGTQFNSAGAVIGAACGLNFAEAGLPTPDGKGRWICQSASSLSGDGN